MSLLREGFIEISALERHKFPVIGLRHYLITKPAPEAVMVSNHGDLEEKDNDAESSDNDDDDDVGKRTDAAIKSAASAEGEDATSSGGRQLLLSWDAKNMYAWQHSRVKHHMNFGNRLENVLNCFAFCASLHVFIANSQKNAFHIFDVNFKLLEVIPHKERMITALEYDSTHDYLIMNGSGGVSIWNLRVKSFLQRKYTFLIEKLFAFPSFSGWPSKVLFEKSTSSIYAFDELKVVTVLSTERRRIVDRIVNIADSKLTQCCWYDKSKLYITSDYSGTLCCWSPSDGASSSPRSLALSAAGHPLLPTVTQGNESNGTVRTCRLLYFFKVHTQQITGLAVHPVTHGVYTTSTDGNLKITDIETLSVLFTVSIGTPIVIFYLRPWIRDYAFTRANAEYNSLMVLSDNSIRVWGPLHCCTTITEFTSDVVGLHCFTPVTYSPRSRERTSSVSYLEAMIGNKQFNALTLDVEEDVKEESSDNESDYDDEILDFKKSNSASPVRAGSIAKIQNPGVAAAEIDSNDRRNETKNQDEEAVFKMNKKNHRRKGKNELKFTRNMTLNGYFVTRTEHYMKVWSSSGKLETSLAEDVVFDGVRSWGISLKQQLIACLMDDRSVRFFGLTKSTRNAPGMIKFSAPAGLYADAPRISAGSEMGKKTADLLHVIPASFFGSSDLPTCISFVDCVPRISGNKKSQKNVSPGGPRATFVSNSTKRSSDPIDFEHHPFEFTRESMVVGGSVGSLRWFDIFNEFRMIHTMEEISGVVESIVCSSSRMLLFVHARNLNDRNKSQIACFKLPGLELTYYIPSISNLSSWIPSKYLPYVGVGTLTGHLRVYFLQPTGDEPFRSIFGKAAEEDEAYKNVLNAARDAAARDAEVMDGDKALSRASGYSYEVTMCDGLVVDTRDQNTANELSGHVDAVTSIEFCDELKCIATCSLDCSVKLWTLDKILLRTIRFDLPVHCISFPVFYQPGDLLLATSKALQVLSEHATGIKNLVNHACNLRSRWLSQTRPSAVADSDLRRVRISSEVGLLGDDIPTSFEQQNSGVSSTPSKQTDANFSVVSLHAHSSSSSDRQKHIVSSPTLSHHPFSRSAVDSTQPQTTSRLNLEDGCGDLKGSIGTFNVRRPANCNAPLRKAKRLAMELPPPKKRPSVFKAYPTAFRGAHRGLSLGSEATDSCSFLPSDVAHQVPDDVASAVSASGPHSLARPSVVPAPPTVAPPSSSAKASMLVRHRVTSGMK